MSHDLGDYVYNSIDYAPIWKDFRSQVYGHLVYRLHGCFDAAKSSVDFFAKKNVISVPMNLSNTPIAHWSITQ